MKNYSDGFKVGDWIVSDFAGHSRHNDCRTPMQIQKITRGNFYYRHNAPILENANSAFYPFTNRTKLVDYLPRDLSHTYKHIKSQRQKEIITVW